MLMDWNSRLLGPPVLTAERSAEPVRGGPISPTAEPADVSPALAAEPREPGASDSLAPAPLLGQLLEGWFADHFTRLWRFVARMGVPNQSIDDVVQDTFITASRRHADIQPGREWTFLVGTALRVSANYRARVAARREVVQTELVDAEASTLPDAEQLLIEKRLRQELDRALATLSDAHRAVFVLYELEGFAAPEISDILSLPLGTVASRLRRARAKFSQTTARMQRAQLTRQEDR